MNEFDSDLWFPDAIRYFRAFGFFQSFPASDDELREAIKAYWQGDWDDFLDGISNRASADQLLLVADTERVWWHDLEGVYRGANYYRSTLNEWSRISRGQFLPEQMEENWHGDAGPIEVAFVLNGQKHIFMHKSGDFLDHEILRLINQTLANKDFHFEVATDYGDSNWITVLDQAEKQRLKTERGWHFLW